MKRSERMAPVQQALESTQQDRARDFGAAQRQLESAEQKLKDLEQYHDEYQRGFQQRARTGQSVTALRDYQVFLARLQDAIRQQTQVVLQARDGLTGSRQRWQSAARKSKAVESVVDRWQQDERRQADRIEQKESDERALLRRQKGNVRSEEKS